MGASSASRSATELPPRVATEVSARVRRAAFCLGRRRGVAARLAATGPGEAREVRAVARKPLCER
eukprot:15447342-Alexandrium_andersonii.AAC.1